jgi:GTP-binding protein
VRSIETVELCATVAKHRLGPRDPRPQVAFAGRSNVGKSSLLNVLFGRKLALVSKSPGKTRTINYYLVNGRIYFVDLPGYGYAKVSQQERVQWGERIASYIRDEGRLQLVVGLIDPRIPTSRLDAELVEFVRSAGRRLLVVLTKADRLGRGALAAAAVRVERDLSLSEAPLAFSARGGTGRGELLKAIGRLAGA